MKAFSYALAFVAVAIACFMLFRSLSWTEAYAALASLRWTFIPAVIALSLLISLAKATRFFVTLRYNGSAASWRKTVHTFLASEAFTLFPAGEVGRALLFRNNLRLEMSEAVVPVFLQAITELWFAAFWVMLSAFVIGAAWGAWLVWLVLLLAALSLPLVIPGPLHDAMVVLRRKWLHFRWTGKLVSLLHAMRRLSADRSDRERARFWSSILLLGLAGRALDGGLMWFIAASVGTHLSFLQSVFAASMAALIQGVLAVIPGGLGVTEGGLVAIFATFGVSWSRSVLITLLYRVVTLPLSVLLALLFLAPLYVARRRQAAIIR
jgi:uncharacterized protein (TIRG00374 family)